MGCSWSTVSTPANLLRAVWDLARYLWRTFRFFWARITTRRNAPTLERIVALRSATPTDVMRRDFSLEARHGSESSMQDSPLSEISTSNGASSAPESVPPNSPTSDSDDPIRANPGGKRKNEQGGADVPQGGVPVQQGGDAVPEGGAPVHQDTPLLQRRPSQRSYEELSTTSGTALTQAGSLDKSYRTF